MKHSPSEFRRPASASGTRLSLPLKTPRAWSSCMRCSHAVWTTVALGSISSHPGLHLLPSWSPRLDPEPDGTCDPIESAQRASPQVSLGRSHSRLRVSSHQSGTYGLHSPGMQQLAFGSICCWKIFHHELGRELTFAKVTSELDEILKV